MPSSSKPTGPSPTRIAVLLVPPLQLLDASPVDLFGMLTRDYLTACRLPAPLIAGAVPMNIHYVAESGPDTIAACTADAGLRVTHGLADEATQPANLDVLMIPGPDPKAVPSGAVKEFVKKHAEGGTQILTVCTGIFVAGHAGILGGKKATGPRPLLGELKKKFPEATWEDHRWTRDGKLWTSAGITNGQDMVAAYIRATWPGPTGEAVLAMADVGERGAEYPTGQARENAWWVWQILRAWMRK